MTPTAFLTDTLLLAGLGFLLLAGLIGVGLVFVAVWKSMKGKSGAWWWTSESFDCEIDDVDHNLYKRCRRAMEKQESK